MKEWWSLVVTSYDSYLKSVEMYNAQTQKWELTNIELSEEKSNEEALWLRQERLKWELTNVELSGAKAYFGFMTIKSQP